MHTKRPLAPSFINRLDKYLLLNKPEVWSARTHLVLYYGILFLALLTAIAFIVPDDPRTRTKMEFWVGLVSLISLVAFIGWLIYLLRFNVFKRYGITSAANRLVTFLLYFTATGVFILFCYVQPAVESIRANAAYSDEEIIQDVNALNLGIVRLEHDSLEHKWSTDTVVVSDEVSENDRDEVMYLSDTNEAYTVTRISRSSLQTRLRTADSVQKINDSFYVLFSPPDYVFISIYDYEDNASKLLGSVDIYRQVVANYKPPANSQRLRNELEAIRKKYQWQWDSGDRYDEESDIRNRIRDRYRLYYINTSMYNIIDRKHRWDAENLPVLIRMFIYPTLILSLLVFAFRHSTAKTFFLSLLTAVILIILTSLAVAFSYNEEKTVLNSVIIYFIIALGISLTAFTIEKRNVVTGIAVNLVLWMLPFIPLCVTGWYYKYMAEPRNYSDPDFYLLRDQMFFWSEVGGMLLLLFVIAPYFHRAYRKWYAAPEN